jgi:hypothetical protein
MFAVIYRWRVIPGREAQFETGWRRGTAAIAREFGGWGSRLHRSSEGVYIAYAQWPDEDTWRAATEAGMRHSDTEAAAMYREAIEPNGFETLFAMPVTSDLLEHRRA